ncbi:MAG: glutamate--tRNA ligase [Alphaproteobacteria bacterium]|nr:glutamate--tRNA ligase [Alphaproteobacteria bacterium]
MATKLRFAPSPTGLIHIGNARTAILNYLYARKHGGEFLLRMDDTDLERSKPEFADAIERDLAWLGLNWDQKERQSDRIARYLEMAEKLKAAGRLYPCYETADELDRKRKRQLARGMPPIYDRKALSLSRDDVAKFEAEGRKPHWRFRLANTPSDTPVEPVATQVTWDDLVRGAQMVDVGSLSDPVLIREDGTFLYTLTSVIDDWDLGVTHIIRGDDHITNTGVQVQLFEAVGAKAPAFGHHSLLTAADGKALSKRLGSLSLASLREQGLEAMAVVSHAALIGTSDAIEPHKTIESLAELFDVGKISTAPARFSEDELRGLNAKLLHTLSYGDVAERLQAMGVTDGEAFWQAVSGNLEILSDAQAWWSVVSGPITPVIENADFLAKASTALPATPWDQDTWKTWTNQVKAETGAKGRALFHPLRLALTGQESGPEMKALLPLIGRDRVVQRLQGEQA